jgi:hypothetical protein
MTQATNQSAAPVEQLRQSAATSSKDSKRGRTLARICETIDSWRASTGLDHVDERTPPRFLRGRLRSAFTAVKLEGLPVANRGGSSPPFRKPTKSFPSISSGNNTDGRREQSPDVC